MTPSTTTVFAGVPRSDMLEAYIHVRALALGREFPAIHTCRVAVEGSDQHGPQHVRLAVATATDAVFAGATVGAGVRRGDLYMLVDRAFERIQAQLIARAACAIAIRRAPWDGGPGDARSVAAQGWQHAPRVRDERRAHARVGVRGIELTALVSQFDGSRSPSAERRGPKDRIAGRRGTCNAPRPRRRAPSYGPTRGATTMEIRGQVGTFWRWMARALVSPVRRLSLVSRSEDELVLTLRLPPRGGPANLELHGSRVGRERISLQVIGRRLVVRGRRRWARASSGPNRPRSTRANLGEWLPRPFSASFSLPFDTERSSVRTTLIEDTLEIRVARKHESTPLA